MSGGRVRILCKRLTLTLYSLERRTLCDIMCLIGMRVISSTMTVRLSKERISMSDEPWYHPTSHLLEKLKTRNVTWAEIVEVMDAPEVIYGPDIQGRKNYQKGDLCVVVDGRGGVITVLLRQEQQWTDEDMKRNWSAHLVTDHAGKNCQAVHEGLSHGQWQNVQNNLA